MRSQGGPVSRAVRKYISSIVNRWSLAPIQCQQEPLILGVLKKKTLFSDNSSVVIQDGYGNSTAVQVSIVLQLSYEAAHL